MPDLDPAKLEKMAPDLLGLVECAMAMRTAQKRYFRHRDATNLERSKEIEREFDRRAALVMHNLTAAPVLL